ncbi:hypothetical protein EZJ58_3494 [Sodalis ligni]|uniref:Uncharacterized protein n=1 Tax=Sodalis ligni TaxID=2697027 RepID=A0A4R1NEL9_9GAMM|nr:hypothetical protein EZJ58_3494 [Sodalis ligni]
MLGITEVVDRLSACFKCPSDNNPATDEGQRAKPGNVNKIVNITYTPSSPSLSAPTLPSQHDAAADSDCTEITSQCHQGARQHSVRFSDEVVVDRPLRLTRPQLKKVTHVVNREVARPQTPLPERQNTLSLSE